jgi:hypothetical protein
MKKKEGNKIHGAARSGKFLSLAIGIFAILFLLTFSGTIASTFTPIASMKTNSPIPGLTLESSTVVPQISPAIQSSPIQAMPNLPTPPSTLGCAEYNNGVWQSIPCLSQLAASSLPKPTEGGSAGVYGLTQSTLLIGTEVKVSLSTFSGETDSSFGSGAFSIQGNTNPFTGSNGDEDGIQFTEQSGAGAGIHVTCIWQVDITKQTYPHTCVSNPVQKLAKGYSVYLSNTALKGKLTTEFCVSSKTCYKVTASDKYGLDKHWTQFSGTLLGLGGGSEAIFTHPTVMHAYVYLFFLDKAKIFNTGPYTEESNNLNIKSNKLSCTSSGIEDCELISESTN